MCPEKASKGFCIQAGGTSGVETLSGYVQAHKSKTLVYPGEAIWVTNARVKLLGTKVEKEEDVGHTM